MISFLIIGIVAGWLAGRFMQGAGFGLIGDLVVGVVGAFLGGFLFNLVGVRSVGTLGKIVTATIGAIALLFIIRLF